MNADTQIAKALERALHARRGGNALLCYDLAMRALAEHPDDVRLAYPAVLALADLGNLELAAELYERYQSRMRAPDEDWLALRGRLYKELALHDPVKAADYYRYSAQAYESAYATTQRPFSGVNAASMHLLAGDAQRAGKLAAEVLLRLNAERQASDSDRYFHHVTRAEACVVLDRLDEAQAALAAADRFLTLDATVRARTLRQLRMLLRTRSLDENLLSGLTLPAFLYATPAQQAGVCVESHSALLQRLRIGALFVVPGLTAEIELAEQVLVAGAPIHVVLPGDAREVLAATAARWGGNWAQRLQRVLEQAQDQSSVMGFVSNEQDRALAYARQVAQGLARLRARQCSAASHALEVERRGTALACRLAEEGITAEAPEPVWQCAPQDTESPALQRRQAALIFADMTGFSQLHDRDLPSYWNALMPEIASALSRHGRHVLLQSTWGDALYIVLDSAQPAAAAGLDILTTLNRVRAKLPGGLAQINVRLSIHYGPVYTGWDPVGLGKLYYGSHVSMAARIEPVTPPGSIYVTEALAAQLALEGADEFEMIYAGEIELAKRYGKRRMFHLRAAQAVMPAQKAAMLAGEGFSTAHELVLGCTGSLLLSSEQVQWVRGALQEQVLPVLREGFASSSLTLTMGLAPGADLTFVEAARDWCLAQGLAWRIRTLLPVPPEMLLADWNDKAMNAGRSGAESETRGHWSAMSRVLNESATVVNLWTAEADADVVRLATRSFRQRQYRKLGAELVRQSDVLIAICDPSAGGEAGGATEVLSWRQDSSRVPPDLLVDRASAGAQRRSLVVLNPVTREVRLEL